MDLKFENGLGVMESGAQRAGIQEVHPGQGLECWSRSGWLERLDLVLEGPVDLETGRNGPSGSLEVGYDPCRVGQSRPGHWM